MMAQANGPTPAPPRRRSIRLRDYDYTRNGAYFVTICAYERWPLFGDIVDGEMRLNAWGEIVQGEWAQTAIVRPNIELDAFVVMPNHIHGIIVITDNTVGATRRVAQMDNDNVARAPRRVAQIDNDNVARAPRRVAQMDNDNVAR
ncbi:MAG: transposase, partial [Chloroflexota bacterium]